MIFFAFCVYKTVLQKNGFLYMNENYNDCHHWKTRRTFLYTQKAKTIAKLFLHKNPYTFQKARQFPLRFYINKNPYTLRYGIFYEIFEVGIYIEKTRHFAKIKTICDTFLYTKTRHFLVTQIFIEFLKFAEWRDIYRLKKQYTLLDIFILKNNALCVTLRYTKSMTLCVTF